MARGRARIERPGVNHRPAGPDPIPNWPTGGGGPKTLVAVWGGSLPEAVATGLVWRVPYAGDGSSLSFSLDRAYARLETPVAGDVEFTLEHSAGGEAAFSASTIVVLTVPASEYEEEDAAFTPVTVDSGDLLRINYTAVGGTAIFHVELTGGEA